MTIADPSQGILARKIAAGVAAGSLKDDPAQRDSIAALDALLDQLATTRLATKKSALGWMFGRRKAVDEGAPRGLYLWGGVGRGKSMLMDMFFEASSIQRKRRVHFHAFMQDVHNRIHDWRQTKSAQKDEDADPIPPIADEMADEARLLCFDEFAVSDVADAMILARLFSELFRHGVTIVATSNVEPDLLYKDGLNRSWFLPFIELVKTRMQVLHLESDTDHRMEKLAQAEVYFTGKNRAKDFDALWHSMTDGLVVEPAEIDRKGRSLVFDTTCGGLLRSEFDALCRKPLGAGDYLAMSGRFHTLFLKSVPVLDVTDRNAIKRFINLIDTWYDEGRILIVEAEGQPSELYPDSKRTESFEFKRTISRLQEMQSADWLKRQEED